MFRGTAPVRKHNWRLGDSRAFRASESKLGSGAVDCARVGVEAAVTAGDVPSAAEHLKWPNKRPFDGRLGWLVVLEIRVIV